MSEQPWSVFKVAADGHVRRQATSQPNKEVVRSIFADICKADSLWLSFTTVQQAFLPELQRDVLFMLADPSKSREYASFV